MINPSEKRIKIIDYTIFVFTIIFLASLSNSIFVNQIGYFGALFFLLVRFAITRQNQFEKTGLEFAFLWFILAELLSAIFSDYQSVAFTNFSKRVLLIPVVYTIIAATTDLRRGKLFFKIYISVTVITFLVYIYASYNYFVNNLYGITESGPDIFQYPITTSEIISFSVIFLFAFLINEKTNYKYKLLIFAGFAVSVLALISTYKRTGWVGTAFGIFIILIMKKQWKLLAAGVLLIVVVFVLQKNVSEVHIFSLKENKIEGENSFKTEGRATSFFPLNDDGKYILADFENGLSFYEASKEIKKNNLPGAVVSVLHWNDDYFAARLVDTRFIVLKKNGEDFDIINELISPGYTSFYAVANNNLYVLDKDSGLTVFTDPLNENAKETFKEFSGCTYLFIDSTIFITGSLMGGFKVFKLEDDKTFTAAAKNETPNLENLWYKNGFIYACYPPGIFIYRFDTENNKLVNSDSLPGLNNVFKSFDIYDDLGVITKHNKIIKINRTKDGKFTQTVLGELQFLPGDAMVQNDKLYLSNVKRSRLLSIFDPYIQSNFNRISMWQAGWRIFLDHPVFGVGDIDLAEHYKKYKRNYDKEIQGHMHNNFVHVLVTLGLFGFLAVCFIFLKIILIDVKIYKQVKTVPFLSSYALGALGGFCGFLVAGLTEMNFWDQEITTLVWFTFGLNYALYLVWRKEKKINYDG